MVPPQFPTLAQAVGEFRAGSITLVLGGVGSGRTRFIRAMKEWAVLYDITPRVPRPTSSCSLSIRVSDIACWWPDGGVQRTGYCQCDTRFRPENLKDWVAATKLQALEHNYTIFLGLEFNHGTAGIDRGDIPGYLSGFFQFADLAVYLEKGHHSYSSALILRNRSGHRKSFTVHFPEKGLTAEETT